VHIFWSAEVQENSSQIEDERAQAHRAQSKDTRGGYHTARACNLDGQPDVWPSDDIQEGCMPRILTGLTAAGLLASGCGVGMVATGETRRETVAIELDKAAHVRAEIRMEAGEVRVKSGTPKLVDAAFTYNVDEWKPVVDYRVTGSGGELNILQPQGARAGFGNTVYKWELDLNADVPLDLVANLGAGEVNLELGHMNLGRVDVNIGAGEVDVDLRGEPRRDYSVYIRGGVGATKVRLPRNARIEATAAKGIGEIDAEGLVRRGSVWMNADAADGAATVRVDVKGGIGEIRLMR
jgi:hypothetical protein